MSTLFVSACFQTSFVKIFLTVLIKINHSLANFLKKITVLKLGRKLSVFNFLNPTGHVMHQQFNIQQLYVLPTLYLCVLYLSENKQRLVPLTA
jgi:hypothetical protein